MSFFRDMMNDEFELGKLIESIRGYNVPEKMVLQTIINGIERGLYKDEFERLRYQIQHWDEPENPIIEEWIQARDEAHANEKEGPPFPIERKPKPLGDGTFVTSDRSLDRRDR